MSAAVAVLVGGSERNYETMTMSAQQHRESADINSSLMALKDCFRACHAQAITPSHFSITAGPDQTKLDHWPLRVPQRTRTGRVPCELFSSRLGRSPDASAASGRRK